jgi:hypothetical protein
MMSVVLWRVDARSPTLRLTCERVG